MPLLRVFFLCQKKSCSHTENVQRFSKANMEGAKIKDIEIANALELDSAYAQYTRDLFSKDSPPESENLSFRVTELTWGSISCMGWIKDSEWTCKLGVGGAITSGNWKVQVSDQRLPQLKPYEMRFAETSNTYPSGDAVFSEDAMYVENRCEDKKNVDKSESQLNVNENVWANIPIDIGNRRPKEKYDGAKDTHLAPAASRKCNVVTRSSTPDILIGDAFRQNYRVKESAPIAEESADGRCQFIDRLWEIKIWKLVPGMTVGFCLRGGSDEGFVPINEDNGSCFEYSSPSDDDSMTMEEEAASSEENGETYDAVSDDIIHSLVVTDGSETLELILQIFYAKFNPSKLSSIPSILHHYTTDSRTLVDMVAAQVEMYKESP